MLGRLLSPQGVVAFWAVYGVAHALLRLSITRTLTLDDSRASELVQTLSLGYQLRQPPLYEWLLWFSQQAFGSGIESHLVVRYSLIALLGIATYGAVRAAVKDDRWAAVASFSLVFSYPVGWTFHEWATQTILLSIACMVTMHAAIRFFEAPSARAASLLGLAIALGLYAKFSYPLFLGGLLAAALSIEETRRRLLDVRLLISLVIAAIAISPYVYWIVQVRGDVVADLSSHLIMSERPHLERAAIGLWRLVSSVLIFLLPWLLFVALLAPKAFLPAPANTAAPSLVERLALRTMLFAAVIAAVGIAASGATNIAERYMHPILIIAPIYVFARIVRLARRRDDPSPLRCIRAGSGGDRFCRQVRRGNGQSAHAWNGARVASALRGACGRVEGARDRRWHGREPACAGGRQLAGVRAYASRRHAGVATGRAPAASGKR